MFFFLEKYQYRFKLNDKELTWKCGIKYIKIERLFGNIVRIVFF